MAATIILLANNNVDQNFINSINPYIESQGLKLISSSPQTYFTTQNMSNNVIKGLVNTIKNTKGFNKSVKTLYYTSNFTKV